MARINHGPRHRRRRRHREACLLIKQRPSPPVKVLLPLPTVPSAPATPLPLWELHKMLDTRALFFVNFQIVFPYFVGLVFPLSIGLCLWHWLSFFRPFFGLFFFFMRPSRGLFCYFCQSQCQIAKALQLVDFCSFCEAFVADLAQQK